MNIGERELELIARLRQLQPLIDRGYAVERGASGDVVIVRDGHVYGIWCVSDDAFAFVPGGYNEATKVARTVEEVLTITQTHFERRA